MTQRICVSCRNSYPIEKFKLRSGKGRQSGQRQTHCQRCFYVKYIRPNIDRKTAVLQQYKVDQGCADCGYNTHPAALHFDHLPGVKKLFNVMERIGSYSMERLWAEIAKCEVVCANCHAVRTAERRIRVDELAVPSAVGS